VMRSIPTAIRSARVAMIYMKLEMNNKYDEGNHTCIK